MRLRKSVDVELLAFLIAEMKKPADVVVLIERAENSFRVRMGQRKLRDSDRPAERDLVEPGIDAPVDNAREKVGKKISGREAERRQYPCETGRSEFRKRDDHAIGGDRDIRAERLVGVADGDQAA